MKKIVFICTNYNSIKDGIGMYTANISKEIKKGIGFEVKMLSAITDKNKGKLGLLSFSMTKEILKFIFNNKGLRKEKINFVVEYPFMDWNPFTIILLIILKKIYINSKFILSIHEYYRVNKFRRWAIDLLIKISDGYIVTDEKLYKKLKGKKILRSIPSNIVRIDSKVEIVREENNYCYFGLINKTKAFNEMIEGWKDFNKNAKNILNIYSASKVEIDDMERYNIKLHRGLSNEELSQEFQKNRYMILPIKPMIDSNNGTLKAAALHGCIPIGKFHKELSHLGINIDEKEYSIKGIENAMKISIDICLKSYEKSLKEYSKKHSFKVNAEQLMKFIKENLE